MSPSSYQFCKHQVSLKLLGEFVCLLFIPHNFIPHWRQTAWCAQTSSPARFTLSPNMCLATSSSRVYTASRTQVSVFSMSFSFCASHLSNKEIPPTSIPQLGGHFESKKLNRRSRVNIHKRRGASKSSNNTMDAMSLSEATSSPNFGSIGKSHKYSQATWYVPELLYM